MYKKADCLFCKRLFVFDTSNKKGKYCSNGCQQQYQIQVRLEKIVTLKSFESLSFGAAKRFAIRICGHRCRLCNRKKWQGKDIPLVLDHINGNSNDWSFANLRLLCCNCDAQTETYKGKNRGNGRYLRRKRYLEGKSY